MRSLAGEIMRRFELHETESFRRDLMRMSWSRLEDFQVGDNQVSEVSRTFREKFTAFDRVNGESFWVESRHFMLSSSV